MEASQYEGATATQINSCFYCDFIPAAGLLHKLRGGAITLVFNEDLIFTLLKGPSPRYRRFNKEPREESRAGENRPQRRRCVEAIQMSLHRRMEPGLRLQLHIIAVLGAMLIGALLARATLG